MDFITESIKNLETLSKALEEYANKKENYNTEYSLYLENLSWDMYRHAAELKSIEGFYVR